MGTTIERAPEQLETTGRRLVTGIRICHLILALGAIALTVWAIASVKPFFALLALGCIIALFVKVRNIRSILAAVAAIETMYFVADMFSPEGGAVVRNVVIAIAGFIVCLAILRLRHWESSTGEGLHHRLHWTAAALGLLLTINTGLVLCTPIVSSQWSSSNTNSACGSLLVHRTFPAAWGTVKVSQISYDCAKARGDRAAYMVLLFEVGLGALYVGREFLQSRRVVTIAGVLLVAAAAAGYGWSNASYSNANTHDEAFRPWINTYYTSFNRLTTANNSLRSALVAGNARSVTAACTQLQAVDDELAPSVADWPSQDVADRSVWQRFLTQHRTDAQNCVKSAAATSSGADLRSSDWFSDSAATIAKLQPTFTYQ